MSPLSVTESAASSESHGWVSTHTSSTQPPLPGPADIQPAVPDGRCDACRYPDASGASPLSRCIRARLRASSFMTGRAGPISQPKLVSIGHELRTDLG
jgi:hypothetical protein